MKIVINNSIKPLLFSFAALCMAITSFAQTAGKSKESRIKDMLVSKNFVFVAQTALPLRGTSVQLTSAYDLRVNGEKVETRLPYFGRAYTAPLNPRDAGINITSTDFKYAIKERKRGGWDINIQPNDNRDVRQMLITVSEKGFARLQVTSMNRDIISYNGYIAAEEK